MKRRGVREVSFWAASLRLMMTVLLLCSGLVGRLLRAGRGCLGRSSFVSELTR